MPIQLLGLHLNVNHHAAILEEAVRCGGSGQESVSDARAKRSK
jgi:hypothetical protein